MLHSTVAFYCLLFLALGQFQMSSCLPVSQENGTDVAANQQKNVGNATEIQQAKNASVAGALEEGEKDKNKPVAVNLGNQTVKQNEEVDKATKPSNTTEPKKNPEKPTKEKESKKSQVPNNNANEKRKKDEISSQADLFSQLYEPFSLAGVADTPAALLSIADLKIVNGKILSSKIDAFKGEK